MSAKSSNSRPTLRIAIAGVGTVGAGLIQILQNKAIPDIKIIAVSSRDKNARRPVDISQYAWVDDAREFAARDDIDLVVETIGGAEGIAYELIKSALSSGKHVVTANKALMAEKGFAIAQLAEKNGAQLRYEAAVAGAIPVIRTIHDFLGANEINHISAILNGTCNYILSEMRRSGRDFSDVLEEAQAQGFAEADPHFDVDGIDSAHKLALLSALAFGVRPTYSDIDIQGIRNVTKDDIRFAEMLGYRIKLLGVAKKVKLPNNSYQIFQQVAPCLVPADSNFGNVEGVYNAVFIDSDMAGKSILMGRGAGALPTASSIILDIMTIAQNKVQPVFGRSAAMLAIPVKASSDSSQMRYYMRFEVIDRKGVLAEITAKMHDCDVSLEAVHQRSEQENKNVSIVITTHKTSPKNIERLQKACLKIESVFELPVYYAIEDF